MLLAKIFENRVNETPDKMSIISDKRKLTFKELDTYANRVKGAILGSLKSGQENNHRIGLFFGHDCDMVAGMLGVLKSGKVYVPIDPNYPKPRVLQILLDSDAEIILTDNKNYEKCKGIQKDLKAEKSVEALVINIENLEDHSEFIDKTIEPATEDQLGYILYTSGSTGIPKGVMQTHKNVNHFIKNYIRNLKITEQDRMTLFSSYCHDASVMDIYSALFSGATLYIIDLKNIEQWSLLTEKMLQERITIWHSVPTVYRAYLRATKEEEQLQEIRHIVLGGEEVISFDVKNFKSRFPNGVLYNLYGQTESSYNSGEFIYSEDYAKELTLGEVVEGADIFLMNEDGEEADVFEIGEIAIVEGGISPGYWKDPERTEEVFVEDSEDERFYLTGDLGRLLSNGKIKFLGRKDNQVKLRGYRIDLGEIESHLLNSDAVSQVAVVCKKDEDFEKYLVAFVTGKENKTIEYLRDEISSTLPDYMIPTHFIELETMPLTTTGKVNRKELVAMDIEAYLSTEDREIVAPRDEVEENLIEIYRDVLKLKIEIGIKDNFFDLGGHSLKATTLVSKIHKEFAVAVSVAEVFRVPTIEGLSEIIKGATESSFNEIELAEEKAYYPMSSAQRRMYLLNQMDKDSTAYNMPKAMILKGEVEKSKLQAVFNGLIQRHESLRTCFLTFEEELVQRVEPYSDGLLDMEYETLSDKEAMAEGEELQGLLREKVEAFIRPFDLEQGPLFRVAVVKISENEHLLMVDMNHIVSDGESMGIIIEDFVRLYGGETLQPLALQYKDYAVWQNQLFESGKIKEQENHWLGVFEGEIPVLNLLTDYPRPAVRTNGGASEEFIIDGELTKRLNRLAKKNESTMYMVLLSALNLLLQKHTGQEDIVVGSPIAGRSHSDLGNIVGVFVNTLAMRNYPRSEMSYKAFLQDVKENALKAYENQDVQFEALVESLSVPRNMSRNPLFDVMFILQNTSGISEDLEVKDVTLSGFDTELETAKFDFTLVAYEVDGEVCFKINYATSLFKSTMIKRLGNHLNKVLEIIVIDPEIKIGDIDLLSYDDKKQIIVDFNGKAQKNTKNMTIQAQFEAQVKKCPDHPALMFEGATMTYQELDQRSNQVARVLREKGVKPDDLVGVMVNRSFEMLVGIMGILKSGGAYLPIDPSYPEDRVTYMLENSEATLILTQKAYEEEIAEKYPNMESINLDDKSIYQGDGTLLDAVNKSSDLAYVIYTSGSTGRPKGVMINHGAVCNFVKGAVEATGMDKARRVLVLTSISFDIFVLETLLPLMDGITSVIASHKESLDNEALAEMINRDKVDTLQGTPSRMKMILDHGHRNRLLKNIERVLVGGEELKLPLLRKLRKHSKADIFNMYGPTEATVWATCRDVTHVEQIDIGKPLPNYKVLIVSNNKIQPIGVAGELCISGNSLARGYLKNQAMTEDKFVKNPFEPGTKMYKTGDLARWLGDGNIEFLGRMDSQVKVRGFRIELGEIESQLQKIPEIKDAAVTVVGEDNEKSLCAYVEGVAGLNVSEIRAALSVTLPEYMIPSYFVEIEAMPMTANGKVDKKALPKPEGMAMTGVEYVAPSNAIEEKLIEIFKDVLNLEIEIGVRENFFELGGHSLKATTLVSKIKREFEVDVPLMEVFKAPTVEQLAEVVKGSEKTIYDAIEPVEKSEYYPMSSAQRRMYIINQMDKNTVAYNMPIILNVKGNLDQEQLEKTFQTLVERHESFRTSFVILEDKYVQKVMEVSETGFAIDYSDVSECDGQEEAIEVAVEAFIRPFDLSQGPLLRVGVIKESDETHVLMVDMHHIISDGVSLGLIIEEFVRIYSGENIEQLELQYKDFAVWQNKLFESGKVQSQEEYWLETFSGEIPVLNLLTDYRRPAIRSEAGASATFLINESLTKGLERLGENKGATTYMVLLSAINLLLQKYTGQEDIVIGSPIAGRPHGDLSNIVGMFVNTLAMRNYPQTEMQFSQLLEEVKENALKAYGNQDVQFEELVDKLGVPRDLSRNPLFDVMFILQNGTDEKNLSLPELELSTYEKANAIAKYDMTFTAVESAGEILLNINYSTSLFKESTINRLGNYLVKALEIIAKNPEIVIADIDLLSEDEKHQLIVGFNGDEIETPSHNLDSVSNLMTIQEQFEAHAMATPDQTALVFDGIEMSYKTLDERSNQVARILRQKGVKPDDLVGLMVDRSFEMLVGIVGILKSGGAYLPIDPSYPEDRVRYMLENSEAALILTQKVYEEDILVKYPKLESINLDDKSIYQGDGSPLNAVNKPSDLAYVIYTSGSTGRPKGVMINHGAVCNFVESAVEATDMDRARRVLVLTSISFDIFVLETLLPLMNGLTAVIASQSESLDNEALSALINRDKVDTLQGTPSRMNMILAYDHKKKLLKNIERILVGGEELKLSLLKKLRKYSQGRIYNMYGPTEATVWATCRDVTDAEKIDIGKPLSKYKVYIASKDQLKPIGVAGELCIAGDSLGRGYLKNEELTEEKFVDNPFEPGKKMYKTGDLARWLGDGNIEFLGRIDSQVKVRGFRIELGEIESQLQKIPEIKDAAVTVVGKENEKSLCAYVVPEHSVANGDSVLGLNSSEIRDVLSVTLPEYMIPSYFVEIDAMPMTANGKVDKKALPKPEGIAMTGVEYVAPSNLVEEKLVEIFKEVLNLEIEIGIRENFFDLGGHSLKATTLVSRIKKEFEVEVPLLEVFKSPTVEKLSKVVIESEKTIYDAIEPIEKRDYYPMSSAQKRMYIINQMDKNTLAYNMPIVLKVMGELNYEQLKGTFKKLIERHESLRTSFTSNEDQLVQKVIEASDVAFAMDYWDIAQSGLDTEDQKAAIEEKLNAFIRPFDLNSSPLFRAGIIKVADQEHVLAVDMHHIISDGVSVGLIVEDFVRLYDGEKLPSLDLQYKDYAVWQNKLYESGKIEPQEKYWLERFSGEIPVMNLLTDYPRLAIRSDRGASKNFVVSETLVEKLNDLSKGSGSTLYMVLLSAFNVLIHKYTGQEDIVIGSPIAGRPHNDLSDIVGMFVNTLAMRNTPKAEMSFSSLLEEVKENALKAYDNQDVQFEELVEKLSVPRDMSRNPIFDVMFTLQNTGFGEMDLSLEDLEFRSYRKDSNVAKYDMTLTAVEVGGEIALKLNYATSLFKESTIERVGSHLIKILEDVTENADMKLYDIDILSEDEKHQLLVGFNGLEDKALIGNTIHETFEERVMEEPDKIALVFENQEMTYGELNQRSNQVARMLRDRGVQPDELIGIMVDRSFEMIIGLMGILKSGGAYLPIDPSYPEERITYMLENSKARMVLTQELYQKDIEEENRNIQCINLDDQDIYEGDSSNLENINKASDLAYVIYTSGSTGQPKGVMIEHSAVYNMVRGVYDKLGLKKAKRILALTSMSFDIFVFETLLPLMKSLTSVIASKTESLDNEALSDMINQNRVDTLQGTPSRMRMLLEFDEKKQLFENISRIVVAGEELKPSLLQSIREHTNANVYNMYGPTEATVYCTGRDVTNAQSVDIGKPLPNYNAYVVSNNQLQLVGVAGELCIAGKGLGRGYLNNEELTKEKFVENPFAPEGRMYRTGDLVRWLEDGNIEFLGRIDNQVKVRGFRIELGEIESQLQKISYIKDAVVTVVGEDGEKAICAYVVSEDPLNISGIREELGNTLPDYMIPSYFMKLDQMPLTANGKVEKRGLPNPIGLVVTGVEYEAPRNAIEEQLVEIFKDVLNLEMAIGIRENFFELGGHSLKAMTLVSKIKKELEVELSLMEVFKAPTVGKLSEKVKGSKKTIYDAIEPVEKRDHYPMSAAQRRMYIVNQMDKQTVAYNMPIVLKIMGDLDYKQLEATFGKLIERHESLRTSFTSEDGELVQKITDGSDVAFAIDHWDIDQLNINQEEKDKLIKEKINGFIRPFDLDSSPLLRVGTIKVGEKDHVLAVDLHHIISDGVSLGLVVEDFVRLYGGENMPPLALQYKDYAVWQKHLYESGKMEPQEHYWIERFDGEIPVLNLTTDYPRQAIRSDAGASVNFVIREELAGKLNNLSKSNSSTLYMVLLSALNVLLHKYTGQEDIVIGSPIAGRPHNDLSDIVGMFVNTLAMRNAPKADMSFRDLLRDVRENALSAYDNQDLQFEELVEKLSIARDMSRNPIFDVMFVLQNTGLGEKDLSLEGLEFRSYGQESNVAKYDMTLTAVEVGGAIGLNLNYGTRLFKESTISRVGSSLIKILEAVADNADIKLCEIDILSENEKQQLLMNFNGLEGKAHISNTICERFEEQVMKSPEKTALVFENQEMTYGELNQRANQVARTLRGKGVKPDDLVGIMVERSLEMIIGIMGILKSGGAYLPIDPNYPKERIEFMLGDSESKLLLSSKVLVEKINFDGEFIDVFNEELFKGESCNLEGVNNSNDLAYVIYTSGTTGNPKGVMIEHSSVNNLVLALNNNIYSMYGKGLNVALVAPYYFDASVQQIFATLLKGHSLNIVPDHVRINGDKLLSFYEESNIDISDCTPSHLNLMTDFVESRANRRLKHLIIGGDVLRIESVKKMLSAFGQLRVTNVYGPTECTVDATSYLVKGDEGDIPIGKPIGNSKIYIVDKQNNTVPIGVYGEVCISGDGLGRGYLNRPELTQEKFVDNPFESEGRMYRTGDLARWLEDGNIEFLGRIDSQVKVRGFRIELGEIESQLQKLSNIKEAAVTVVGEESDKAICAYVVSEEPLNISAIREELGNTLPEYMIPSYFTKLDQMPLTANGKVDKKGLPNPEVAVVTGVEYEAPRNPIDEKLDELFRKVLNIENPIGIKENFFELGGHSLKANSLILLIYKELEVEVPLMEVFKSPTIEKLSDLISKLDYRCYDAIDPVGESEFYPMSSIQERLFTAYELNRKSLAYNMPIIVKFEGEINKEKFRNAIEGLTRRHDALRTNFSLKEERFVQRVSRYEDSDLNFEYHIAKDQKEIEQISKEFVRPFDLGKDLLIRVGLIICPGNEYVVMLDTHHIVSDAASNKILLEDYNKLYNGIELDTPRIQYADFSSWENKMLNDNQWEQSREYWKGLFENDFEETKLPYDYKVDKTHPNYQQAEKLQWRLEGELYESLKKIAMDNNGTLYMVMLAALNMVMSRFANSEDIIIASPNVGRYHPELEQMVGVFINLVPMRNYPKGELAIGEFLSHVIENTQKAMENAKYPYQKIMKQIYADGRNKADALTKVSFNYLNFYEKDLGSDHSERGTSAYSIETLKNDIDIAAVYQSKGINITVKYDKSLFIKEKMETFIKNMIISLEHIASQPKTQIQQIEFTNATAETQKGRIEDFNSNLLESYYDKYGQGTIQSRLQETFSNHGKNVAIKFAGKEYSYGDLDKNSDIIAQFLRNKRIATGEFVGVHLTNPAEIVVVLLGIMKARAVFVPLNPEFPNQRLRNMVQGTEIKHILTSYELEKELKEGIINEIPCEAHIIGPKTYAVESVASGWGTYSEQDEIYVCFTSGTTGIPKAIVGVNESLKNFVEWEIDRFQFTRDTVVSQVSAYSNDAYFRDIFGAMFVGGTISIPPQRIAMMSAENIVNWVDDSDINVLHCTPSLFALINSGELKATNYKGLKHVLLAGEPVNPSSLGKWYKLFGDRIQIVNLYGASETTLVKMYYPIQPEDIDRVHIPIGKPIDGTKVILLNANGMPCSDGEVGELFVRTPFMTKGYFNDKALTDTKFIQNPFMETEDLIYRSGDYAVALGDGNYVFEGRMDDQVKIRGNRVELSAISSLLLDYEGVENCAVVVREENGDKHICAYMKKTEEAQVDEIRRHLKNQLADYMIPSYFVVVDEFKLNANGKIDKKALPKPEVNVSHNGEYVGPRTREEKQVENGWRKVLNIKGSISIKDNFFEIGGHSIIMLQLADYLRRTFELDEVMLIDLYENPTIEEMASFLSSADHEEKIYYELTKSKQTNVAIYAVPYMGGDASCYGALAREFDNQNIGVKLMSTSIFDVGNEVDGVKLTIEEFARIRAREIVAQGEDNIFLLGHCGGTFMTIAIADELKAMNVKVKGIFLSGMVPMQEPNKILVEAEKRRTFRQFIAMLRGLGFTDRLNVTVAKRYRNAIIEMTEFRYRRNKKLKHKVFKHWTPVYSMVADRDPETFDHKRGYKRWKRFAHKVEHIVLESRSHYFISRSADDVTMEIDRIIKNTKSVSRGKGNGPNVDTEVVSETVIEKTN